MKNLVLIIVAMIGVSSISFGQTEPTKPKVDKTLRTTKTGKETANKPVKKVRPVVDKKKEVPAEKIKY